jgi:hypothetical protein
MAGIGSTLVEAVHLGRDAIGVEYEPSVGRPGPRQHRLRPLPGRDRPRRGGLRRRSPWHKRRRPRGGRPGRLGAHLPAVRAVAPRPDHRQAWTGHRQSPPPVLDRSGQPGTRRARRASRRCGPSLPAAPACSARTVPRGSSAASRATPNCRNSPGHWPKQQRAAASRFPNLSAPDLAMCLEIATNFHDQWVILLCLRLCPTLRDEFVTQAYVRAARDGRGIPEPFKRGPTARVPPRRVGHLSA